MDADAIRWVIRNGNLDVHLHCVRSESEFLLAVEQDSWDLVLADYALPSFTGAQALSVLRRSGSAAPFVLISGYLDGEAAVALMRQGASDYVPKADLGRLVPVIERELADSQARSERRRFQELLAAVARTIGVGLIAVNEQGAISLFNPEAERLTGRSTDDLIGRDLTAALPPESAMDATGAPFALRAAEVASGRSRSWAGDGWLQRPDGRRTAMACGISTIVAGEAGGGVLMSLTDIDERRRHEEERERSRERLRALSHHLDKLQEHERRRLARELHDELGQQLLTLKLDAEWLHTRYGSDPAARVRTEELLALSGRMVDGVRSITADLHPHMLEELGLVAALEWLVNGFRQRTGISCGFRSAAEQCPLSRDAAVAIYRIVQEALTNVAKHAAATAVEINVERRGDMLHVVIRDDGRGFDMSERDRHVTFGLFGMRERAEAIGGSFTCDTRPDAGCRLDIAVPLESRTERPK